MVDELTTRTALVTRGRGACWHCEKPSHKEKKCWMIHPELVLEWKRLKNASASQLASRHVVGSATSTPRRGDIVS